MSKVISAEQLSEYLRWEKPDVSGQQQGITQTNASMMTAKKVENIQQQAYQEAYAKGEKEGKQAGEGMYKEQLQRLSQLFNALDKPLDAIDDEFIEQIVSLIITVSRHIIRREISVDPGEVVAVVREGLTQLPVASRNIKVILNPDDAGLVKDAIKPSETESSIAVVEDPVITRGGCRIVTDTSQVDATVESRLASIAAKILGGDREGDSNDS